MAGDFVIWRFLTGYKFSALKLVRRSFLTMAIAAACGCISVGASWQDDRAVLLATLRSVIGKATIDADAITRLNEWVYHEQGFAKNQEYFLLPRFGPTPVQVLHSGGDCSDKSRLLSALLEVGGVRSGLVMLYPCENCAPVHTVVEVHLDDNTDMIADPIWDVDYRMSRVALAASNNAKERVEYFRKIHADDPKIMFMPPQDAEFKGSKSVNFEANSVARTAAQLLRVIGINTERMIRPTFLEDPKLLMILTTGVLALLFVISWAATFFLSLGRETCDRSLNDARQQRALPCDALTRD